MWESGIGYGRRLRIFAALVAVAALSVGSASAARAVPGTFWGVVPQATPTPEQLQRLKAGGVDSIRIPLVWSVLQLNQGGPIDWSGADSLIGNAATAGIEVLPYLNAAPTWAVAADRRYGSPATLPVRTATQRSGWKNFARQAVLRYGPAGSFWAENPAVPRRPIRTWQIWNEENFMYFVARPNPADYGKLVKLSYAALKSVDKGAKVILGGLFARPRQALSKRKPRTAFFATEFLQEMYRRTPGIKSKFNGIALHPYTRSYIYLAPEIEEVRDVLIANNDAGKSLWLTELGWSSQPPSRGNSFAKGPSGQAKQLKGAFRVLKQNQRKWHLQRVYWFSVDDAPPGACNFCPGAGLFSEGFAPKPSWYAYVRFAGGAP